MATQYCVYIPATAEASTRTDTPARTYTDVSGDCLAVDAASLEVRADIHTLMHCCIVCINGEHFIAAATDSTHTSVSADTDAATAAAKKRLCAAIRNATISKYDRYIFGEYVRYLKTTAEPESGIFKIFGADNLYEYTIFYILGTRIYHESLLRCSVANLLERHITDALSRDRFDDIIVRHLAERTGCQLTDTVVAHQHICEYGAMLFANQYDRYLGGNVGPAVDINGRTDNGCNVVDIKGRTDNGIAAVSNNGSTDINIDEHAPHIRYESDNIYHIGYWRAIETGTEDAVPDAECIASVIYLIDILYRARVPLFDDHPNDIMFATMYLCHLLHRRYCCDTFIQSCKCVADAMGATGTTAQAMSATWLARIQTFITNLSPDANDPANFQIRHAGAGNTRTDTSDIPETRCILTDAKYDEHAGYTLVAQLTSDCLYNLHANLECRASWVRQEPVTEHGVASGAAEHDVVYVYLHTKNCADIL